MRIQSNYCQVCKMRKYKFANSHMQRAQPFFLQSEVDRQRIIWKSELLSLPSGFLHTASNKGWGDSTGAPLVFGNLGLYKQVHDPWINQKLPLPGFHICMTQFIFKCTERNNFF